MDPDLIPSPRHTPIGGRRPDGRRNWPEFDTDKHDDGVLDWVDRSPGHMWIGFTLFIIVAALLFGGLTYAISVTIENKPPAETTNGR
jgi:hypothetical protein